MAQQREFNEDSEGSRIPRDGRVLVSDRGVGSRPATFVGGDIDPITGNVMPGGKKTGAQGFVVSGSEAPPPPAPAPPPTAPQIIDQIVAQPEPPPAPPPPPPAPMFIREDKSNGIEQISKWFCYGRDVEIRMEDGTYKPVQDIALGDRVALGGEVTAVGKAKGSFTFDYKGQRVSGSHAVFEDGRFVRVYEAKHRSEEDDYQGAIYPVATAEHLLVTRTHISADFTECEGGYDMTPVQRLSKMNREVERLQWLRSMEAKLCREPV